MKQELETAIAAAVKELFNADVAIELTRPEEQFGDYAANVALQLAKQVGQNPREIAETLTAKLREALADQVSEIAIAGPGFINLKLSDQTLVAALEQAPAKSLAGQTVVAEYSDPNPFKVLHAGHLYTTVVGNAVANLLESAGAKITRINFGGDVGLHVAKTMWALINQLGGEYPEELPKLIMIGDLDLQAGLLSTSYVRGNRAYEEDETAKAEIVAYNQRIYQIHEEDDKSSNFAKLYWTCRQWSYDYFKYFYQTIGVTPFDRYLPESETAPLGLQTVKEHIGDVYQESDGAVIFEGEKYGLHTRVFINSQGLPTYEAKDVGLIMKKWQDYKFDLSVMVTGNDIVEYMKVVLKSVEQFAPEPAQRSQHLTHGQIKLAGGKKMSSRKGNILEALEVVEAAAEAARAANPETFNRQVVCDAFKYAFLKQRTGGDIIYDPEESVSLEGNSGPYLQYAHARARSILAKAGRPAAAIAELEVGERSLARKISEYPEVVDKAVQELMPHHVCTYLYELAQTFNRFYEHNRVIGDERQVTRLTLVNHYADTLRKGLTLLGIASPDKM